MPTMKHIKRWRRNRRKALDAIICASVQWFAGSKANHVTVESGGIVLESLVFGNVYYAKADYDRVCDSIVRAYHIPSDVIQVQQPNDGRKSPWPSYLKFFTRGLTRSNDCVCIARRLLSEAGYHVPRHVISPSGLDRWLNKQGFNYEQRQAGVPDEYVPGETASSS